MKRRPLPDTRNSITKRFSLVAPVNADECAPELASLHALAAQAISALGAVTLPDAQKTAGELAAALAVLDNAPPRVREMKIYFTVDMYDDGAPGGVFIKADRAGSFISGVLEGVAIQLSIALQHGVPLYVLIEKMRATKFEPAGRTGDPETPSCTSILDLLVRWLEKKFPAYAAPTWPPIDTTKAA